MRLLIVGILASLALACGDDKPPQKTVFDPQVQALKKARAVGQQLEEAAQQQREQIEHQQQSEK
jgi:hypothetical protein